MFVDNIYPLNRGNCVENLQVPASGGIANRSENKPRGFLVTAHNKWEISTGFLENN